MLYTKSGADVRIAVAVAQLKAETGATPYPVFCERLARSAEAVGEYNLAGRWWEYAARVSLGHNRTAHYEEAARAAYERADARVGALPWASIEALKAAQQWLDTLLKSPVVPWDPQQRLAAQEDLTRAREALAAIAQGVPVSGGPGNG